MTLFEKVKVAPRFQKAIRIDSDFGTPSSLEGFICPKSSADILLSMVKHITETGQSAFTWTGPYGSGKSSLALALCALLNGQKPLRKEAVEIFGESFAKEIWKGMPPLSKGWRILPIVGRRESPAQVIGKAIETARFSSKKKNEWTEETVLKSLDEISKEDSKKYGGLIVFIDEMGKFLEASAQDESDVYLFQLLAEQASRSDGRLVVIGILHQSFAEYANRLSREVRDEWSKIQGRFVDLPVNTAGEEQIEVLARAIESCPPPKKQKVLAKLVSKNIKSQRPGVSQHLEKGLAECWPLHPITAALLGPVSRRRFGQNQRSLFGFLISAEPFGFQDFLKSSKNNGLYEPYLLWDYLRANLEPAILASPDGHRWAIAAEAIDRAEAKASDTFFGRLLKTIAIIDLFKEHSGLAANNDLLTTSFPDKTFKEVRQALKNLQDWSLIIFKKFLGTYAIFAGSDFDIEQAIAEAKDEIGEIDNNSLGYLVGLQPILAKRHFHTTGAMRWFDVSISPLKELKDTVNSFSPRDGAIGQFLLAIPTQNEDEETAKLLCRLAARETKDWDIVIGLSTRSWLITQLVFEFLALEKVQNGRPELAGDEVARREVQARCTELQTQLEASINRAVDKADWYRKNHSPKLLSKNKLNEFASNLADKKFYSAPKIQNELLNRIKPSGSAVGAQNTLLRRMVTYDGKPNLGIQGFPAERGLFESILKETGLYVNKKGWHFVKPGELKKEDKYNLFPMWEAASNHLKKNKRRTVSLSEIYDLWGKAPLGVKDGLKPVLAVAFILSNRDKIAFYRQGIFQAKFKDLDVDILARDPRDIQLRWMDLSKVARKLLSGMAEIVRELDKDNALAHLEPIDVARGLISIYEGLHPLTKRTMLLSSNAKKIRTIFNKAHDPNKFLFDDLPAAISGSDNPKAKENLRSVIKNVHQGLEEMVQAYPSMLDRIRNQMLSELQVPNTSPQALSELRERAENIKQLTGDFQLEAFIGRISNFSGEDSEIEGICSLAVSKPPGDWVDADLDRAAIEIADLCQRFNRAEAFARVKGRKDKRQAMAVIVGTNGRPAPFLEEFDVTDLDKVRIDAIVKKVEKALSSKDVEKRNIILAALAEISAKYIKQGIPPKEKEKPQRKRA